MGWFNGISWDFMGFHQFIVVATSTYNHLTGNAAPFFAGCHWLRCLGAVSLPRLQPHVPRAAPRLPLPHRALRCRAVPGPGVSAAEAWHPRTGEKLATGKLGMGRLEPWNHLARSLLILFSICWFFYFYFWCCFLLSLPKQVLGVMFFGSVPLSSFGDHLGEVNSTLGWSQKRSKKSLWTAWQFPHWWLSYFLQNNIIFPNCCWAKKLKSIHRYIHHKSNS